MVTSLRNVGLSNVKNIVDGDNPKRHRFAEKAQRLGAPEKHKTEEATLIKARHAKSKIHSTATHSARKNPGSQKT